MTDLVHPAAERRAPAPSLGDPVEGPLEEGPAAPVSRRLAALAVLVAVVSGLLWLGHAAWTAFRDAFVAPLELSPDSAPIMQNKLRLTELQLERARALADAETAAADLADADLERARLTTLRRTAAAGEAWPEQVQGLEAGAGRAALENVARREGVIARMITKQQRFLEASKRNLEAGLITRAEHEREEQRLDELTLSLLEASRTRLDAERAFKQVRLAQRSLARVPGVPLMPETVSREDLETKVDVQLLHVEARKRTREAERRALLFRVERIDEVVAQLERLPLYQATTTPLDVAFVPYTQLDAVHAGAEVLQCTLIIFGCHVVGRVVTLVPGEVVQPDPWGTSERGQYALLELDDRRALQARTLRVRRLWEAP